ncbi:MAG: hypothetical protein JXI43_04760 [Tissierellales bacterium]|nr:hypothetical protein [Tissierellales bacterium]
MDNKIIRRKVNVFYFLFKALIIISIGSYYHCNTMFDNPFAEDSDPFKLQCKISAEDNSVILSWTAYNLEDNPSITILRRQEGDEFYDTIHKCWDYESGCFKENITSEFKDGCAYYYKITIPCKNNTNCESEESGVYVHYAKNNEIKVNLKLDYDTLNGLINLSWDKQDTNIVSKYYVCRYLGEHPDLQENFDTIAYPINNKFIDTLFNIDTFKNCSTDTSFEIGYKLGIHKRDAQVYWAVDTPKVITYPMITLPPPAPVFDTVILDTVSSTIQIRWNSVTVGDLNYYRWSINQSLLDTSHDTILAYKVFSECDDLISQKLVSFTLMAVDHSKMVSKPVVIDSIYVPNPRRYYSISKPEKPIGSTDIKTDDKYSFFLNTIPDANVSQKELGYCLVIKKSGSNIDTIVDINQSIPSVSYSFPEKGQYFVQFLVSLLRNHCVSSELSEPLIVNRY